MGLIEPTELEDVRLSFLATRGEDEPPTLDWKVRSGGVVVEEIVVEGKFLTDERAIDKTPSP